METNSLFPLKYRLRKTDELVEIVAWETAEKGTRSENDWVSYIDANGNEHVKEHLTLEWDFVIQTPFEKGFMDAFKTDLPKFDMWEARRYELAKHYFFEEGVHNYDKAIEYADEFIEALKKSSEAEEFVEGVQMDDGYENIGIGEIVEKNEDVAKLCSNEWSDEDEKIRKQLIQGMENLEKTGRVYFYNASIKDALAWLERQKEPESASASTMIPSCWEEKRKEQNGYYPIENCDYGLEIAYDILEKTFGEVRGYKTDDGIREHQTAIEAVRKAKEQKPAEWSEEDEKVFADISWAIRHCAYDDKKKERVMKWFNDDYRNSLRPQPKWKPREEQINELHGALIPGHGYDCDVLQGLYADLKN